MVTVTLTNSGTRPKIKWFLETISNLTPVSFKNPKDPNNPNYYLVSVTSAPYIASVFASFQYKLSFFGWLVDTFGDNIITSVTDGNANPITQVSDPAQCVYS